MRKLVGLFIAIVVSLGLIGLHLHSVDAQEATEGDLSSLKDEIDTKQANIDQINRQISTYRDQIAAKESQATTLTGEVDLLTNRIALTQLDQQATQAQIDSENIQIALLTAEQKKLEEDLNRQTDSLKGLLQKLGKEDEAVNLELVFGSDHFSDIFDRLQRLASLNGDLSDALRSVKSSQDQVNAKKAEEEGKKAQLVELNKNLEKAKTQLEQQIGAKQSLLADTQNSEDEFKSLLTSLREEQTYIDHEIGRLQSEVDTKLQTGGGAADIKGISYPTDHRRISTYFHDPTYPFRNLFEHSGLDMPMPVGTDVHAAAPGYVARARLDRLYGNYVMIIHANGLATIYAHLSHIGVKPDQYVARGQIIGQSGGAAGAPGSGLSTGPHLHFEVRKGGVPVNPLDYLSKTIISMFLETAIKILGWGMALIPLIAFALITARAIIGSAKDDGLIFGLAMLGVTIFLTGVAILVLVYATDFFPALLKTL